LQIYPIVAALFTANSAPAFAFFKFMQVGYLVCKIVNCGKILVYHLLIHAP